MFGFLCVLIYRNIFLETVLVHINKNKQYRYKRTHNIDIKIIR